MCELKAHSLLTKSRFLVGSYLICLVYLGSVYHCIPIYLWPTPPLLVAISCFESDKPMLTLEKSPLISEKNRTFCWITIVTHVCF